MNREEIASAIGKVAPIEGESADELLMRVADAAISAMGSGVKPGLNTHLERLISWLEASISCPAHAYDADQLEAAVHDLVEAKAALTPAPVSVEEAVLAERERCAHIAQKVAAPESDAIQRELEEMSAGAAKLARLGLSATRDAAGQIADAIRKPTPPQEEGQ